MPFSQAIINKALEENPLCVGCGNKADEFHSVLGLHEELIEIAENTFGYLVTDPPSDYEELRDKVLPLSSNPFYVEGSLFLPESDGLPFCGKCHDGAHAAALREAKKRGFKIVNCHAPPAILAEVSIQIAKNGGLVNRSAAIDLLRKISESNHPKSQKATKILSEWGQKGLFPLCPTGTVTPVSFIPLPLKTDYFIQYQCLENLDDENPFCYFDRETQARFLRHQQTPQPFFSEPPPYLAQAALNLQQSLSKFFLNQTGQRVEI